MNLPLSQIKERGFFIFFLFLILVSFGVKTFQFGDTYSGFHLVRQMDNLAAIEDYYFEGIDFLKRRVLSEGGSYVLLELPVFQNLVAWLSPSYEALQPTARLVNLSFALLSMVMVFKIANLWFGRATAMYSTLFFAFAPLNMSYQRAFMMDISTVCFCLVATWLLIEILQGSTEIKYYFFFIIFGALSVTTKPLYYLPVIVIFLVHFFFRFRSPYIANTLKYIKDHTRLVVSFFIVTLALIGWLTITNNVNGEGQGMMKFLKWTFLFSPKFYALMVFRFVTLILNPFTIIMFFIGALVIWKFGKSKEEISLILLVPVYYVLFGDINFPHEYYSLIMVPYCSIIAGYGAFWIERQLNEGGLIKDRFFWKGMVCVLASITSTVIFLLNFIVGIPGFNQTTFRMEQEMRNVLEPRQNSYIFMNREGFPVTDFVKHNRSLFVLAKIKNLPEKEIRDLGNPITLQEVLFALRQFGKIHITDGEVPSLDPIYLQKEFGNNLHYMIFYKYNARQRDTIKNKMNKIPLMYHSEDWLVYEMKGQS